MEQLLHKQITKGMSLFITLVFSSSFALADFKNVDCIKDQKVLGISTVECQVLEKLWDTTGGKDWYENQGWDTLTNASKWDGIVLESGKISSLLLYSNNLKGKIPSELGELSALKRLSLSNNTLFGEISPSIGQLSKLEYLELSNNNIGGTIPSSLGTLSALTELYLDNNQFSGKIPDSLGDLENLQVLKIYANNLSGNIPFTFGALSNLDSLSLAENNLTGAIPQELGELSKLVYLDLKSNKLSGTIPPQLGNLESLTGLYLQNNRLTGNIPSQLGNLSALTDLDLSTNELKGNIPSSLGSLSALTYLNVANNQLSGDIPLEFLNLTILNYLNLEENKFVFSNIESIHSELLYIPNYIFSFPENENNNSLSEVKHIETELHIENDNLEEKRKSIKVKTESISIKVLSEDEVAMLNMETLKIVGTVEAGDALVIENEGTWSIEDDKIVFTPFVSFKGMPKSIFYTIKNGDGVESNPIEVSLKRNETESLTINVLENEKRDTELYNVEISLSEDFNDKHPEAILSQNRKKLIVDSQGVWNVENNGTVTFSPEEGFVSNPSNIDYLVFSKNGDKFAVGKIDMNANLNRTNSVALFGIKGLLLMMLFGGLFGMFYMRESEK
jgi:Leucine-rich repeat (LRR) protein